MHRYIRTTNAIESFFSNVQQRIDVIDTYTMETSYITLIWVIMQDIRLQKIPADSYINGLFVIRMHFSE